MVIAARKCVQVVFLALVLVIGIKFYLFVSQIEAGILPDFERPPGVEAFLPISALVSLKHFLFTGTINSVHPSALVLFLIICLTAVIAKKGFCSWVCPFGLLSEFFSRMHLQIFKNGLSLPLWIDTLLRSLKYIIAVFFIYTIFLKMPLTSIEHFINSPYNRFADITMLKLFTNISGTTLTVILLLLLISVFIRNAWCRYLCPYGALLGIISFISIGKIKRHPAYCTDCGKCEKKCPGLIKIRQKRIINSSECIACMDCVKTCPEKQAIEFSMFSGKFPINPTLLAMIFVFMFVVGISVAKKSGNWQNEISNQGYLHYFVQSNMQKLRGGNIDSEKMMKMMQVIKAQRAQMNLSLGKNNN